MRGYDPYGRAHSTLRRLAQGTASFDSLQRFACANCSPSKLAKYRWLTRAMLHDGLIQTDGQIYAITADGRDALGRLERGETVGAEARPTVRIFVQREPAHG